LKTATKDQEGVRLVERKREKNNIRGHKERFEANKDIKLKY